MLMAYLTLISGLLISAVAIFYSVAGLTSIFSAAVLPIIIMGTTLEVAKLVATVWLKQNWEIAPKFLKGYLLGAVIVLMFITSMGIFGFLSKAHSDQTLVSGDVQSKIAVYDEKIKIEKDNIDANRKSLKQMDEAVDQVMARSTTEGGADKAVGIRRSQQKERSRLVTEIGESQKKISALSEQRAPIAAEVRKVEAEVGPIKYIAAFVYGETNEGILEKAVTWVIILIVIVFDPLAVMLLLASQYSFGLLRPKEQDPEEEGTEEEFFDHARELAQSLDAGTYVSTIYPPTGPITSWTTTTYDPEPEDDLEDINRQLAEAKETYEADDGPLTAEQIEQIREIVKDDLPTGEVITKETLFPEEEFPFRGKGTQPGMPLTASYIQPNTTLDLEDFETQDPATAKGTEIEALLETVAQNPLAMDERPGDYVDTPDATVTHTADGTVVGFLDGTTQEILVDDSTDVKELVEKHGYSIDRGIVKVANREYTEDTFKELMNTGYVQNEEQKESDVWTKIVNKTITEEEYLAQIKDRQNKKDE